MSDVLVAAGGEVTPTAWAPARDLTYQEWEAAGRTLQQIGRAWQWWVGDWLTYGEARYGEKYAQAVDVTGLGYQALADAAWVAAAVQPSLRNENLSWSHHRAVAGLDEDEQRDWLAWAERKTASVQRLRREVRGEPNLEAQRHLAAVLRGASWETPQAGEEAGTVADAHERAATGEQVAVLVPARTHADWWWNYCRHAEIHLLREPLRGAGAAVVVFGRPAAVKWSE